jgi:membrane protease subunit HflK
VAIQNAQPPEQVQAAFNDAVKAGQDRERQINEGQAYANDVIPKARGMAERLKQEAEGYKSRIVETADGDASRFKQVLTEYQKAPAVTRDRMYLDAMQQMFSNTSKVMVDSKGGNNLLYLPLDKLMQQSAGDAGTVSAPRPAGAPPLPTEPAAPAAEATRSRDALRNRDSR